MKEKKSIRQQLLWGLLIAVLAGIAGTALWMRQGGRLLQQMREERPLEGLGFFGTVPDFSLVERSGRRMVLANLLGKVWVVNFIYTHCPDSCPIQSARMKELQTEFSGAENLRLVSITVDPERDSAKVLWQYANRYDANPERWLFLTGEQGVIYRLAQEGFRLGAAEIPRAKRDASGATHIHSPRFVLVDDKAQIRGYYPGTDGEAMVRLRRDLRILLRGGK